MRASGPGVHVGFESNAAFENCIFTDNRTVKGKHTADGGSIYVESKAALSFTDCKITGNRVADRAPGVYLKGNGVFLRCEVTGNVGGSRGGGIYVDPGNENTYGRGGEFGGNLNISDSVIANNTIGRGGGLYINSENRKPNIIKNCIIEGNDVSANSIGNGGGLLFYNSVGLVEDCMINGNKANYGGGVIIDVQSSVNILRTTIAGNYARINGGGLYCHDGSHNTDPMYDVGNVFIGDSTVIKNTSGEALNIIADDVNIHWSENGDKKPAGWVARYDGYIIGASGNTIGAVTGRENFFTSAQSGK